MGAVDANVCNRPTFTKDNLLAFFLTSDGKLDFHECQTMAVCKKPSTGDWKQASSIDHSILNIHTFLQEHRADRLFQEVSLVVGGSYDCNPAHEVGLTGGFNRRF